VSLASRRRNRDDSRQDDAKSSIVGLSGWLFADLLLALAVVFLVASERPSETSAQQESVSDIDVFFSAERNGDRINQVTTIDESFSLWVNFDEPVSSKTFGLDDLLIEPLAAASEWSFQIENTSEDEAEEFQIWLYPQRISLESFTLYVKSGSVLSADRTSAFNREGSIDVEVQKCERRAGIAVNKPEVARFTVSGGESMNEDALVSWLEREDNRNDRGERGTQYGGAQIVWRELNNRPSGTRRKIGFVILFGGYSKGEGEGADDGLGRADAQVPTVKAALIRLGLLDEDSVSGQNSCPVYTVPIRPFGDGSVSKKDLKFELYFYNNE
jgi:hypothetical protein